MGRSLTYSRDVFDVVDERQARRVILTPDGEQDTEERWERETPYLVEMIGDLLRPQRHGLYLDYGCGIGRLAKPLIEHFDCRILGVDISERMRALAPTYVGSQSFSVISPHVLHSLADRGLRADGAMSIWVLQHCLTPAQDIDLIRSALAPGAGFFVLNMEARAVPTKEGAWANDGVDVAALLAERLSLERSEKPSGAVLSPDTVQISRWGLYRKA